jgi:hypothetical protein
VNITKLQISKEKGSSFPLPLNKELIPIPRFTILLILTVLAPET